MSKLIFNKITIDKSDKDIKTGITYELSSGLNLICGNNEAGKSSLMKFIKEGFFRPTETDNGKIYFSVDDKRYRADIKTSSKRQDRLKLFDDNNSEINSDIIEQLINQKYFEQGFTINLDDLMTLKYDNDSSLVNVIKDPSGDKLNALTQSYKDTITNYIGDKNKPKKSLSEISSKINDLNQRINELSQKESEYNNLVILIKQLKEELKTYLDKKEFVNYLIEKKENDKKVNEINSQIKTKKAQFNSKLYDNRQEYNQIVPNTGIYISNLDNISRLESKIEDTNAKIQDITKKLHENFSITAKKEDFLSFEIDYSKINKIKNLIEEINEKNSEINAYKKNIEDVEETLLKLENDLKAVKSSNQNLSSDELTSLFSLLDNGLKQIKSIDYDINELEKEKNAKQGFIIINQIGLWLLAIGSAIGGAYFFAMHQLKYASIFTALFVLFLALIYLAFKKNPIKEKFERKESLKKGIIKELINNVQTYFPEISNIDGSFLILKLEEIVQSLKNTIDKTTQISMDKEFNLSKIKNYNEKISDLRNQITDISEQISNLLQDNIAPDGKTYIEAANIINNIKDEFINLNNLTEEMEQLKRNNIEISDKFNSFITDNKIDINLSLDFRENFEELRRYTERNNDLKKEIEGLEIASENLKSNEKEHQYKHFSDINDYDDLAAVLKEIEYQINDKQNKIHDFEIDKSKLEDVESLIDLKNERNITLNKYRNIVQDILTAKSILNVMSIAKKNFDKTQPDLINAQKYLKLLTNGKYEKINLELQEISDEKETVIKKWNNLSRGTKEQLYLALRLGYASNYTLKDSKRPNLPLIIDDAFVNFDAQRTKSTLKCLSEFSKTNQILFFTCHTQSIKKLFEELELNEKVNCVEL